QRRDHPHRDGDAEGEEQRDAAQAEGGGQALEDETEGILLVAERLAEIPADRAGHEARVLHGEGIVEAGALTELVEVLRLDVHGQEEEHGTAAEPSEEEDGGEREEDDEEG